MPHCNQRLRHGSVTPWIVLAILAALLVLILVFKPTAALREDSALSHPAVGKPLPDVELVPLTGNASAVTTENLAGKVVLIHFWGTWCGPCQQEFPHLVALARNFAQQSDFQLVSVSCGPDGGYEDVDQLRLETERFMNAMRSNLPTHCDPDMSARRAVDKAVGFPGYPMTLVMDRQGIIRGVWNGYAPGMERSLESLVASLLVTKTGTSAAADP
jgi:hypothetical protein